MYIESTEIIQGLYLVIVYSVGHHILLEKQVYASSFTEAEQEVRNYIRGLNAI